MRSELTHQVWLIMYQSWFVVCNTRTTVTYRGSWVPSAWACSEGSLKCCCKSKTMLI